MTSKQEISSYGIQIEGFTNPKEFVEKWSSLYKYGNEEKYHHNIDSVLESKHSFLELFKWKNGTGDTISKSKSVTIEEFWNKKDVLIELRFNFSWDLFESEFQPSRTHNIWKLFLLHLVKPDYFPIYDQHVFRFFNFHKTGKIEEIPTNHKERYLGYKDDYLGWFNSIKKSYDLNPKKMDESFFSYGQCLKNIKHLNLDVIKYK